MCYKVGFKSKELALNGIKQISFERKKYSKQIKSAKAGRKMYAYKCVYCYDWHLTTQKPRKYG